MKLFLTFAAVAICAASMVTPAEADSVPNGSYQRSCRDIEAEGNRLSANCRTQDGEWNYTTLRNYRACESDISNNDGQLLCHEDWRNEDDEQDSGLPSGSYQRTCRNEEAERRTLQAECRDRNGRWRYTELADYRSCSGDISNIDGMLQCRRGPYGDDDDVDELPDGSWRASCRNYRVYGRVLFAECRDRYGRYSQTSLDLRNCRRDVSNYAGRLVCGQGHTPGRIIVFKHSNFSGKSRTYSGDVSDLNVDGLDNMVSSVVVQGGVWQLCDKPRYRGFCVVIDRTNSNLWALGFNDRAESIRQLR